MYPTFHSLEPFLDVLTLSYVSVTLVFTRLRKELGMHKEEELELHREALRSEIQFLKSVSVIAMNKAFTQVNKIYFFCKNAGHTVCWSRAEAIVLLKYRKKVWKIVIHFTNVELGK